MPHGDVRRSERRLGAHRPLAPVTVRSRPASPWSGAGRTQAKAVASPAMVASCWRPRHAARNTPTHGQDSASATHTFRTVTLICAPILRSLTRIVPHWARASSVPASTSRLSALTSTYATDENHRGREAQRQEEQGAEEGLPNGSLFDDEGTDHGVVDEVVRAHEQAEGQEQHEDESGDHGR